QRQVLQLARSGYDHQIWFERDDLLQIRVERIADLLLLLSRFWKIAVTRHAGDAIAQSERKKNFGHVRGERDDAPRIGGNRYRAANAVGEFAVITRGATLRAVRSGARAPRKEEQCGKSKQKLFGFGHQKGAEHKRRKPQTRRIERV